MNKPTPEQQASNRLRQQKRRAGLQKIAVEAGFESWTKVATAVLNGEATITKLDPVTAGEGKTK